MTRADVVIVDIETGGLDPLTCGIFEIGMMFCDLKLNVINSVQTLVPNSFTKYELGSLERRSAQRHEPGNYLDEDLKEADLVWNMHKESGLANEIMSFPGPDVSLEDVENYFIDVMAGHGVGKGQAAVPMTGSSVHFDRKFLETQMPNLADAFHYRNIDTSTLKGIVDIYRPDLKQARIDTLKPAKRHRVLDDCEDTRKEYKFYLEHMVLATKD